MISLITIIIIRFSDKTPATFYYLPIWGIGIMTWLDMFSATANQKVIKCNVMDQYPYFPDKTNALYRIKSPFRDVENSLDVMLSS